MKLTGLNGAAFLISLLAAGAAWAQLPPSVACSGCWIPPVVTSWQWQLEGVVDESVPAEMYNIDLFENDADTVARLHSAGRKVICYMSAGSWEEWRPDRDDFPAEVIGNQYTGWKGERWLDIRRLDVLGPIMQARLDQCQAKGFDGVEFDNIDGYQLDTGFPLTYEDQLQYNVFLANEAHQRGLNAAYKNNPDQIADLVAYFDWALVEECARYGECHRYLPFLEAGKAVMVAEYRKSPKRFCRILNGLNFNGMKKKLSLNAWRIPCRGGNLPPKGLGEVTHWAYQIQDLSRKKAVDRLVSSRYDMLVLEPTRTDWSSEDRSFDTRAMVNQIKSSLGRGGSHRKLVLAYVDIGEAEDWRWYWTWSRGWDCTTPRPSDWPSFILTCDPDGWTGNYPVAFWDPDWKDIVIYGRNQSSAPHGDYTSVIDEAIRDGFDGIYLDWVEAFSNEAVIAAAQGLALDPAAEMIGFIQEMRTYSQARKPGFLIVQQNAPDLLTGHPELLGVIDGIAQEAIWFDGEATDRWGYRRGRDLENSVELTEWTTNLLDQYRGAGLPVFSCEYALGRAQDAYERSLAKGYAPYATRRALSRLSTTPPPGY